MPSNIENVNRRISVSYDRNKKQYHVRVDDKPVARLTHQHVLWALADALATWAEEEDYESDTMDKSLEKKIKAALDGS